MAAVGGRKQAIHCSHIPFFNNVTVTGGTT